MQTLITNEEITFLPVEQILPNPYQSRKIFNTKSLKQLADSIKQFGVIKPLTVRHINNNLYELISGERRLKACKMAGITQIPTFIKTYNNKDSIIISLIENMQRERLNFFEEAESFQRLMVDFGLNIDEISQNIGRTKEHVLSKLKLLSLTKEIRNIIIQNNLDEEQVKQILRLDDLKKQQEVIQKIIKYRLNIHSTQKLVDSILKNLPEKNLENAKKIKAFITDVRLFTNTIKNSVEIMKDSGFDTHYNINKTENGYEININLNMNNKRV